jgi:hypothetical protein
MSLSLSLARSLFLSALWLIYCTFSLSDDNECSHIGSFGNGASGVTASRGQKQVNQALQTIKKPPHAARDKSSQYEQIFSTCKTYAIPLQTLKEALLSLEFK